MGQKVHPIGFRLGITKPWQARWFPQQGKYQDWLHEDIKIRAFVLKYLAHAMVARVETARTDKRLALVIHTARPGAVIGRKGQEVNELRKRLGAMTDKMVDVSIAEIQNPSSEAPLVAQAIAGQLEKRVSFRRAIRKAIGDSRRAGVLGIKVMVAGRLGGAEIARTEWQRDGRVPLHTLRADVDFGKAEALTTHGKIGVKVWIFRGEILGGGKAPLSGSVPRAATAPGGSGEEA